VAARALKRIASPYAVVLTGTPLENRLEELISIVQFVDPHRLGPTWRLLEEHQQRDDAGRVVGYRALDRIGQTLAPVMLRRRKAEVLAQLPARVDQRIFVPLTPEQRKHHDENGDTVARIVRAGARRATCRTSTSGCCSARCRTCAWPATAPGCWTTRPTTGTRSTS
jgi:SNF2 family DNA or RNA helicase